MKRLANRIMAIQAEDAVLVLGPIACIVIAFAYAMGTLP